MLSKKLQKIREFIKEDKLRSSIIEMNDLLVLLYHIDSTSSSLIQEYQNQIILLENRLNRVRLDEISNTKSSEQISIEKNYKPRCSLE